VSEEAKDVLYERAGAVLATELATKWLTLSPRSCSSGRILRRMTHRPDGVPAHVVSIRGKLPAEGAVQWSGSFSISAFSKTSAPPAEYQEISGDFVAKHFPQGNSSIVLSTERIQYPNSPADVCIFGTAGAPFAGTAISELSVLREAPAPRSQWHQGDPKECRDRFPEP
jgi:hypothetical protein